MAEALCQFCKPWLAASLAFAVDGLPVPFPEAAQTPKHLSRSSQQVREQFNSQCWLCYRTSKGLDSLRERQILDFEQQDGANVSLQCRMIADCFPDSACTALSIDLWCGDSSTAICYRPENVESRYDDRGRKVQRLRYRLTLPSSHGLKQTAALEKAKALDSFPSEDAWQDYLTETAGLERQTEVGHLNPKRLETIRGWLKDCQTTHDSLTCPTERPQDAGFIPKRLLQIESISGRAQVRLIETHDAPITKKLEYATLSHCWGRIPFKTLTESNIDDFHQGIDLSELTPTFREAINLCHDLGLSFVWIDSLCIVQDSKGGVDWLEQAPIMHQVYKNSFLNLTAAASSAGSEGLITKLCLPALQEIEVEFTSPTDGLERKCLASVGEHQPFETWHSLPVFQRSWCIQELFLAPRTLFFGDVQMLWKCASGTQPEMWTVRLNLRCVNDLMLRNYLNDLDDLYKDTTRDVRALFVDKAWEYVSDDYSTTQCTKKMDRVYALAGLAAHFASLYSDAGVNTRYMIGSWEHNLLQSLLWYRINQHTQAVVISSDQNPEPYLPSWSWLSVDGSGYIATLTERIDPIVQFVATDIDSTHGDMEFGPVKSARLVVEAPIFRLTMRRDRKPKGAAPSACSLLDDDVDVYLNGQTTSLPLPRTGQSGLPLDRKELYTRLHWDNRGSTKNQGGFELTGAFVAVSGAEASSRHIYALILEKCPKSYDDSVGLDSYTRVGVINIGTSVEGHVESLSGKPISAPATPPRDVVSQPSFEPGDVLSMLGAMLAEEAGRKSESLGSTAMDALLGFLDRSYATHERFCLE